MKYIYIFFLTFTIFFSPCSNGFCSEMESMVNQIIADHAVKQKKENNLILIGAGSSIPEKIQGFTLHYISDKKLNLPEARSLGIKVINSLLNSINNDARIRNNLSNFPFNSTNVNVLIRFENDSGLRYEKPYIALISVFDGKIHFSFYDNQSKKYLHKESITESYQEALEVVNDQNRISQE